MYKQVVDHQNVDVVGLGGDFCYQMNLCYENHDLLQMNYCNQYQHLHFWNDGASHIQNEINFMENAPFFSRQIHLYL